jgi:hypothetical protein
MIVLSAPNESSAPGKIIVRPITHTEPGPETYAIEIPASVCEKAGLDAGRSWIILAEFNVFDWPGYDLAMIPGSDPSTIAYGHLTPGFLTKLQRIFLDLDRAGLTKAVVRD